MDAIGVNHPGQGRAGQPRVVLFGMRCTFTGPVLAALAESHDIDLAAAVLPGNTPSPRAQPDPVMDTIESRGIRLIEVPSRADLSLADFRHALERVSPDAIVVACFPWRLPAWILALPPRGCLNLHPSLLPDGRGPEPVFWAFRRGLDGTGVTLHLMNERFDAGPVIAQVRVPIPDGATITSLEQSLAEIGADLALDHVRGTSGFPHATPQPEGGEYAPFPRADDLIVPTSWDARRAARFIHAAIPVYGAIPVLVLATGQRLLVEEVSGIDGMTPDAPPLSIQRGTARIRFANGTVTCRIAHAHHTLRLHP